MNPTLPFPRKKKLSKWIDILIFMDLYIHTLAIQIANYQYTIDTIEFT